MAREVTELFGKTLVQTCEVKNQSNPTRRGENCLLDQVNLLPCRGNSTTPEVLCASLKENISAMSPLAYFYLLAFLLD